MTHFKCNDCGGKFTAVSLKEVTLAEEGKDKKHSNYAKFCPYCGSLDILYTLGAKEKGHGHER